MIFYMKINVNVFFRLIILLLLVIVMHAQSTQNSKFVISLQYLSSAFLGRPEYLSNLQRCHHGCHRVEKSSKYMPADSLKITLRKGEYLRYLLSS